MDAIAPLCPSCLFFVEGTGQSNARANWGDGFITDEDFIRENGKISSAKPFFDKLVEKPYISQVVLSPHIYCPSSSKASDGFAGARSSSSGSTGPSARRPRARATATPTGPATSLLSSSGRPPTTSTAAARRRSSAGTLWSSTSRPGPSGARASSAGWYYWGWNSNSADTGGIVSSANPRDIDWQKVDSLRGLGF